MTRKLEELFNIDEIPDPVLVEIEDKHEILAEANTIIDKINQALPQVGDLDTADNEMDELADLAKAKFNDLMDLGMNVEARFSGTIFQTAGVLLGHAITAKQAKIDKKLRMIDLQLKKMRLDQQAAKDAATNALPNANAVDGHAIVLDRNELLRQILDQQSAKELE